MTSEQAQEVAATFDLSPELLPYLDELLADISAMGSQPEIVIELCRFLDLEPESTRILDLACGKGALSIPLAAELGFHVDGVDLFPPFIEEARRRATAASVGERCCFEVADLRERLSPSPPYDVVGLARGRRPAPSSCRW